MKETSMADPSKLGYMGSGVRKRAHVSAENDEWYTPEKWLNFASYVLGSIELDPFSSPKANQRVNAKRYFTADDDAFRQSWDAKTVWMNPPYTRGVVDQSATKLLSELEAGNVRYAIVLVNNMTDTQWYRRLLDKCRAKCDLTGRISFENALGQKVSGNTRGQTLFLFASGRGSQHVINRFKTGLTNMGQIPLEKM